MSSGSKGSGPSSAVGEMSSTSPAVRSLEKLDNYVRESHSSIRILCAQFDTSGDGLLSHSELEAALGSLLTANEIKGLIEFLDAGHDGTIDLQEVEPVAGAPGVPKTTAMLLISFAFPRGAYHCSGSFRAAQFCQSPNSRLPSLSSLISFRTPP